MVTFEIEYVRTGTQQKDKVWISERDKVNDIVVHNIIDAISAFEQYAIGWGTYENKNAITSIKVIER